jgi:c-di-GMP-binding flagellar brake protein YcgR
MGTAAERRRYHRFEVPCRLRIEWPSGREVQTRSANISDGGVYFVTDEVIEVGREVTVRLAVPRDTANTFFLEQFAAQVIRRDPPDDEHQGIGIALQFANELPLDLP